MKRNLMIVAAVVFSLAVGVAAAQSPTKVNVPFSFNVNDHAMPAGSYNLSEIRQHTALLAIYNGPKMMAIAEYCESAQKQQPKMVFHKIGDRYYLSQIWLTSGNDGLEFPVSKSEKEARVAANTEPAGAETVVIALR